MLVKGLIPYRTRCNVQINMTRMQKKASHLGYYKHLKEEFMTSYSSFENI